VIVNVDQVNGPDFTTGDAREPHPSRMGSTATTWLADREHRRRP
jgi:hypothetical protein